MSGGRISELSEVGLAAPPWLRPLRGRDGCSVTIPTNDSEMRP